jgi:four helix bundle protein
MFTHQKLKVYAKALEFFATVTNWLPGWGKRHAVADQLGRASESLVLNLAEGSRLRLPFRKAQALDYALGSTLECAACLDLAAIKQFVESPEVGEQKRRLREITLMLIALRKAWLASAIREDPTGYQAGPIAPEPERLFHHERLEVYQVGLTFVRWFTAQPGGQELSHRLDRRVDQAATGMVLNIAEGNGRYSELDQTRFLEMAATATVKASTYLDLWRQSACPTSPETAPGREFLRRIMAMLEKMIN